MGFRWRRHSGAKSKKSLARSVLEQQASADGKISMNGSKDEAFFDTFESLGSDYEDEFYSVRGDLSPMDTGTPKRASSISTPGTPQSNRDPLIIAFSDTKSQHSPKKKLSAFLEEEPPGDETEAKLTINNGKPLDEGTNGSTGKCIEHPPKSSDPTTNGKSEGSNTEGTPNASKDKGKSQKGMVCCLPRRSRSVRFSEED